MLFRLLYHAITNTNDSILKNIIGINDDDQKFDIEYKQYL